MKRSTEWTCEVCEAKEVVVSKGNNNGLNLPNGWRIVSLKVQPHSISERGEKYIESNFFEEIVFCGECILNLRRHSYHVEETSKQFQKTFWQRFLGRLK